MRLTIVEMDLEEHPNFTALKEFVKLSKDEPEGYNTIGDSVAFLEQKVDGTVSISTGLLMQHGYSGVSLPKIMTEDGTIHNVSDENFTRI